MELWRRLILLFFVCTAILLAKFADLSPLVLVKYIDFAREQKEEGSYMGVRIMTDEDERLSRLPLNEYIQEKSKGKIFSATSKEWEELLGTVIAVSQEKAVAKVWQKRLPSDKYPSKVFFFRPDEAPVNALAGSFKHDNDVVYISLTRGNKTEYLEAEYRTYNNEDFLLGSGFTNYPTPPIYMLFPYRKYSLLLILFGLLLYIFLPVQQKNPDAIKYPRWRMVLGDVVSFLMIVPFFAFPFLITGGTLQAFTQGWPLFFFFWPIFILGIWLLFISAWLAGFSIIVTDDRLRFFTSKGEREFLYIDMDFYQPVIFKSPKWLIALSWIAALSGKGSSRIGATGRAMILSGSASGSIGIRLKNGADIFINITDQMGSTALKGFEKILDKLKENGVQEKDEVREIRSLGLETMKLPDRSISAHR
jgi:hypothetical protein